jgi:zinc D-Ala-D-Ala dipeptidase
MSSSSLNSIELVDLKECGFLIDLGESKKYSDATTFYLNKPAAEALQRAKEELPPLYNFVIKDGFRTLETQKRIVEITEKELRETNPDNWLELLNIYTGGYEDLKQVKISYMNHRSGNTVDLTIANNREELDMGGVALNDRDRIDYFENNPSTNQTDIEIRNNRRLLRNILEKAGFEVYPLEWWHWGFAK